MNCLVQKADMLLKNGCFEYAVCGGFAIELFLNKEIRNHGDIDISAFWDERDKIILYMQSLGWSVYELCGGGMAHHITDVAKQYKTKRNILCMMNDCEIVSLTPTKEPDMFVVDFDLKGKKDLTFIEVLFNNKENDRFLYSRNQDISLPLTQAILNRNGINYLAPEMVLLYKSTDTQRDGYQLDYDMAMRAMTESQKQWLQEALKTMNPDGYKWLNECPIMSFNDFLSFRNVRIRNKDHERIVRLFYPYLSSVCGGVPDSLSKVISKIVGVDFSENKIITGCFNGISDDSEPPVETPDFNCKWDNGFRLYIYGALPKSEIVPLKENEYVLFVLSDNTKPETTKMPDRYVCVAADEVIEILEDAE